MKPIHFALLSFVVWIAGVSARDDLTFFYDNRNVSFLDLQRKLRTTIDWSPSICPDQLPQSYSCVKRCKPVSERDPGTERQCYCDSLCMEIGDCCYDYVSRCTPGQQWRVSSNEKRSCVDVNNNFEGQIFITGCSNNYTNKEISAKCKSANRGSYMVSGIPVYDVRTNVSYRNVYCALCNNVRQWRYWKLSFGCESFFVVLGNISSDAYTKKLMKFVKRSCQRSYLITNEIRNALRPCSLQDKVCFSVFANTSSLLLARNLCRLYSLPFNDRKNPHCALCTKSRSAIGSCRTPIRYSKYIPPPPPLTIIFDVQPKNKYRISITRQFWSPEQNVRTGKYHCNTSQVFDPFALACKALPIRPRPVLHKLRRPPKIKTNFNYAVNKPQKTTTNSSYADNKVKLFLSQANCTVAVFNVTRVTFASDGSVSVRYHGNYHRYDNGTYFIHGNSVYACLRKSTDTPVTSQITWLQILTYTGSSLSILAGIVLLVVCALLKEIRNIPGRITMHLIFSLVVYQVFFMMVGLRDIRGFCVFVAVVVHYFLLTSFAWMSVMAFDVMKTFGSRATVIHATSRRILIKYSCYAYGLPAVIVITSVMLDKLGAAEFGYGTYAYCWIGKPVPLIITVHVPVAMVFLFNACALVWTLIGIRRTQKSTEIARPTRHSSPIRQNAFLGLKLSVVLGLTWILGLLVGFVTWPPLQYAYVILNSLQGFFITVAFISSKKTRSFLRKKTSKRRMQPSHSEDSIATKETKI